MAADAATYGLAVKMIFLCMAWYTLSSFNNIVGKLILSDFPYPLTVTMFQLFSTAIYSMPMLKVWAVPRWDYQQIACKYWFKMMFPLAFGKVFSLIMAHISIWKVPVSYAHTVKATMPFFVVVLSRCIMKEKQTKQVYLSLVPIIGGVVLASLTEIAFDVIGLLSALLSTFGFALLNIFSKKCLKDTGIHHIRLLVVLSVIACCYVFPLWLFHDVRLIWNDDSLLRSSHSQRLLALLLIDGFCSFAQNLVAFTVIALVSPLSYAVANTTKRVCVIGVSLLLLRNPVTPLNLVGMGMAVVGVLLYNKIKFDQKMAQRRESILPYVQSAANLKALGGMNNGYVSRGGAPPAAAGDRLSSLLLQNAHAERQFGGSVYFPSDARLPTDSDARRTLRYEDVRVT